MGECYIDNTSPPALNYRVVGGTATPGNPKENTIWVNTSDMITDHVFSATAPEMADGRVWIKTGADSVVRMNVLKKNNVTVYPASCEQCVGGAWIPKLAKTYINGAWVDWMLYLTINGDDSRGTTGGWTGTDGCLTFPNGTMNITAQKFGGSVSYGAAYTNNAVDLSHWSKATITVTEVDSGTDSKRYFAVFQKIPTGQSGEDIAEKMLTSIPITGPGTYSLPLYDVTGAYRVGFYVNGYGYNKASITTTEVLLTN